MVSPLFNSTPLYHYDKPDRSGRGRDDDDDIDMASGSEPELDPAPRGAGRSRGRSSHPGRFGFGGRESQAEGDETGDVDDAIDELLSDPEDARGKRVTGRGKQRAVEDLEDEDEKVGQEEGEEVDELDDEEDERLVRGKRKGKGKRSRGLGDVEDTGEAGEGDDEGEGEGRTRADGEEAACEWDECTEICTNPDTLAIHLKDEHIASAKDVDWACLWRGCSRGGQKQSSRNSLATHLRQHSGEKPYRCTEENCKAAFTRSDGLNKHKRLAHGIGPPIPLTVSQARKVELFTHRPNPNLTSLDYSPTVHISDLPAVGGTGTATPDRVTGVAGTGRASALAGLTNAEQELCDDEDLVDAMYRIRERRKMRFYAVNSEENAAVRRMREQRDAEARAARVERRAAARAASSSLAPPGKANGKGGRGKGKEGRDTDKDSDSDGFDEGVGENYPTEREVQGIFADPAAGAGGAGGGAAAPVMGLSRGQARYVIAKAKFMLVEEENGMRLDELRFWQDEEERIIGAGKAT